MSLLKRKKVETPMNNSTFGVVTGEKSSCFHPKENGFRKSGTVSQLTATQPVAEQKIAQPKAEK